MSRVLVKVGGAQLEDAASRAGLARAVYTARDAGHEIILVHGGGNQIRALTDRLGIEDRYHDGLRVTDAATAEAVLMVLGGQVNRWLVHALEKSKVKAIGLTGADGGTFTAQAHRPGGVDLGALALGVEQGRLAEGLVLALVVELGPEDRLVEARDAARLDHLPEGGGRRVGPLGEGEEVALLDAPHSQCPPKPVLDADVRKPNHTVLNAHDRS